MLTPSPAVPDLSIDSLNSAVMRVSSPIWILKDPYDYSQKDIQNGIHNLPNWIFSEEGGCHWSRMGRPRGSKDVGTLLLLIRQSTN